ncbi:N-acetyltransferase family protein [Ectopseudomonas guguanensis]|uniref:GNAT family N-acetyltransferase n=1 Tax=Ectopseudomonas guguanensis TaxID=1198456 RepID=UPI0039C28674
MASPDTARETNAKIDEHWIEHLNDGSHVLIRPIRPEDREREAEFIRNLSPQSRHFRFLGAVKEASPALLDTLLQTDHSHRMAFVALAYQDGKLIEVGVSRYAASEENGHCECAVTVADAWQRRGLGTALMRHLIETARQNGFQQMYSVDDAANTHLQTLAHELGFQRTRDPEDATLVIHRLEL